MDIIIATFVAATALTGFSFAMYKFFDTLKPRHDLLVAILFVEFLVAYPLAWILIVEALTGKSIIF